MPLDTERSRAVRARRILLRALAPLMAAALVGCGGGGGGSIAANPPVTTTPTGPTWTAGVFAAASTFAAQCQSPRSGTDASTGRAIPDRAGSALAGALLAALLDQRSVPLVFGGARHRSRADVRHA